MAGLSGLSVRPGVYNDDFSKDFFWQTFYKQHLGRGFSGISVFKNGKFRTERKPGLFRPSFGEIIRNFSGTEGIGYCGPAREPLYVKRSKFGSFSACFSGNVANCEDLVEEFSHGNHILKREDDIVVMSALIVQGADIIEGIKWMTRRIEGAYALLILTQEGIYAVRCPSAQWPLVIGKKKGAVLVASESGGFSNFGFEFVRDVKPGEIILLKNGDYKTKEIFSEGEAQECSFYGVYTSFPCGIVQNLPSSLIRKRLGAALARQDIENGFFPDMVCPVPDSGRFHAIGYLEEFCRQINEGKISRVPIYDEILLKYPYADRSYTLQKKEERDLEAHIKILPSAERYDGKIVVVCEDSIVRGTQTQTNLVPKLRSLGVKEIHFRISNPELLSHCPWGKTTKRGEPLAQRMRSIEERVEFLGVESLRYNSVDVLVDILGLPREVLCIDCDLSQE